MKRLSIICGGLWMLSVHAAVDLEVVDAQGKKTVTLMKDEKTVMYTVSNNEGEKGNVLVTLIRESEKKIGLTFVSEVIRVDKSTKYSHPISVELNLNEMTPIQFDIVHGGILLCITPRKNMPQKSE